jgi:hypothetical protein
MKNLPKKRTSLVANNSLYCPKPPIHFAAATTTLIVPIIVNAEFWIKPLVFLGEICVCDDRVRHCL